MSNARGILGIVGGKKLYLPEEVLLEHGHGSDHLRCSSCRETMKLFVKTSISYMSSLVGPGFRESERE